MLKSELPVVTPTLHQPLHSKVTNYLNDQRRQGQYCDLILELETGDSINGHFCVVAAQSRFIGGPHFQQKNLHFSIHNPLKVQIKNFSCSECLQTIGDFFYEDMVTIIKEHVQHFKDLAKILVVGELMKVFQIPEENQEDIMEIKNGFSLERGDEPLETGLLCDSVGGGVVAGVDNPAKKNAKAGDIFDEKKTYFKVW